MSDSAEIRRLQELTREQAANEFVEHTGVDLAVDAVVGLALDDARGVARVLAQFEDYAAWTQRLSNVLSEEPSLPRAWKTAPHRRRSRLNPEVLREIDQACSGVHKAALPLRAAVGEIQREVDDPCSADDPPGLLQALEAGRVLIRRTTRSTDWPDLAFAFALDFWWAAAHRGKLTAKLVYLAARAGWDWSVVDAKGESRDPERYWARRRHDAKQDHPLDPRDATSVTAVNLGVYLALRNPPPALQIVPPVPPEALVAHFLQLQDR